MNWDAIAKVAAVVLPVAAGALRFFMGGGFRARSNLKTDCEILRTLDPSDQSYSLVKQHVDNELDRVYAPYDQSKRNLQKVASLVYVATAIVIGTYFYLHDFAWYWYSIPIYLLAGTMGMLAWDVSRRGRGGAQDRLLEGAYADFGKLAYEQESVRDDPVLESAVHRINELRDESLH